MGAMKTPGVYIREVNAFPNSVVEVATAVPAFIGYTEKADNKGKSLKNQPWRITSLAEFITFFGGAPNPQFTLAAAQPAASGQPAPAATTPPPFTVSGADYTLTQAAGKYQLYYNMQLFFQNGGGACYIVSVGSYSDAIDAEKLQAGIDLLLKEQEPTMVVIPEAVLLEQSKCYSLQQAMLMHCGDKTKSRVAILDIFNGFNSRQDNDPVAAFRDGVGKNFLNYGIAYYPWVNTTIVDANKLSLKNLDDASKALLQKIVTTDLGLDKDLTDDEKKDQQKVRKREDLSKLVKGIADPSDNPHDALLALSPSYKTILTQVAAQLNLLPTSAAMAGIYTMVDNNRGVWKAPANVSLSAVTSPAVSITNEQQEDLNVNTQGKSINAIRAFIGEGTLVWGARTLDGNSLDWRYVNVRRTMIMLEESVKLATKAYVFEPNVANTWVTVKSMIRNFLTGIWKKGGLAGAVPDDAFAVFCGLGETMTPEDILEGTMRVTVLVAISRPAEFIEITFQQQMQKS